MYRIERKTINPRSLRINTNDGARSGAKANALAESMIAGGWQGEPVIVGPDLRHLDGQHRICAAVCAFLDLIPVIVLHGPAYQLPDGWAEYVQAHPDGHTFRAHDVWVWPYREYAAMTPEDVADAHEISIPLARVVQGIVAGAGWEFAAEDGELLVWPAGDRSNDWMRITSKASGQLVCTGDNAGGWARNFAPEPGDLLTELESAWDEVMS